MNEFLPIEIIFNLLCIMRREHPQSSEALRSAMQRRGLIYGSLEAAPACPSGCICARQPRC